MHERIIALALVATAFGGCAQKAKSRPPWADGDCMGTECGRPGVGHGVVVDAAQGSVPSTEAGLSDAGERARVDVKLTLRGAVDLETTSSEAFDETASVFELAQRTASTWEQTRVGEISVPGTPVSTPQGGAWFWLKPEASSPWLSSVVWLAAEPSRVSVPMFPRTLLQDIGASLINLPVLPSESMGHVLVRVQDEQGNGLPAVTGTVTAGVLAYGASGTANDVQMQTGDSGLIVWFNAPTAAATKLVLNHQAESRSYSFPVLQASVTSTTVTWNEEMP